ncbi:MAG: hypothetical protein ABI324_23805 [Ktedonobacteraceae bacterium]
MMPHHLYRNYRIISVLFWSFPYLLWQAFGHWSGFLVGVIVAIILTVMLNNLFRRGNWNMATSARRQSLQTAEPQPRYQEEYQRGYRTEGKRYRAGPQLYQAGANQPQYEEMQVPYLQEELPPIEQS